MADDERAQALGSLRKQMGVAFAAAGVKPDSEEYKKALAQIEVGFEHGWTAALASRPPPAPAAFGGAPPHVAAPLPGAPRARKTADLREGETGWIQPMALLEHRSSGAIYLDPLFDTRPEKEDGFTVRITVGPDGRITAHGPGDEHRLTDQPPDMNGMRMVARFETT